MIGDELWDAADDFDRAAEAGIEPTLNHAAAKLLRQRAAKLVANHVHDYRLAMACVCGEHLQGTAWRDTPLGEVRR